MTLLTSSHAPGVYYEHFDRGAPVIGPGRTDIAGFVGVAEKGPVGEPVRLRSWRQFLARFGTVLPFGYLALAVRAFFANGGVECWVVRAAAAGHTTTPDPAAVASADGRTVAIIPAPGFVAGAVLTAIRHEDDVEATRTVAGVDRASGRVTWDAPLPPSLWLDHPIVMQLDEPGGPSRTHAVTRSGPQPVDRGSSLLVTTAGLPVGAPVRILQRGRQRPSSHCILSARGRLLEVAPPLSPAALAASLLELTTGAVSAGAWLRDVRGRPAVWIAAASAGIWGNSLEVRAVISAGAATSARPGQGDNPAWATAVADVAGFGRGDLVVLRPGPRPWERVFALVAEVDADRGMLIWQPADQRRRPPWSRPLPDGVNAGAGTGITRLDLDLTVAGPGAAVTTYAGLSLLPGHPRFIETVLVDPAPVTARLADSNDRDPERMAALPGAARLTGGGDGLAALTGSDLIGLSVRDGAAPGFATGLGALDGVDAVAILAIPDAHLRPAPLPGLLPPDPPDPCPCPPEIAPPPPEPPLLEDPPEMTEAQIAEVHAALVEQCEYRRDRVTLLEAPRTPGEPDQEALAQARRWRRRFDTSFAALYHPWLEVLDPSRPGETRATPPSGHVAGTCALGDLATGVHRAPAGYPLEAVHSPAALVDDARHGLANGESINCIRAYVGRGVRVMGARTLSSDPALRYLNVRRLLGAIEEAVDEGLQWAVFAPATHQLRELVRLAIAGLLEGYWRAGALRGDTPDEAFYVRCDDENNPPAAVDRGELVADVGVAIAAPAEFVVFRVGRTANELRITESLGGRS